MEVPCVENQFSSFFYVGINQVQQLLKILEEKKIEYEFNRNNPNQIRIKAKNKIGSIKIDNIQILITPKFNFKNLMYLLYNSSTSINEFVDDHNLFSYFKKFEIDDLYWYIKIIGDLFERHLKNILNIGLSKTYIKERNKSFGRGKIKWSKNILRFQNLMKLDTSIMKQNYNTVENRMIFGFLDFILYFDNDLSEKTFNSLKKLKFEIHQMGIKPFQYYEMQESIDKIILTRMNNYYSDILILMRNVIENKTIDWNVGENKFYSIWIITSTIYQNFLYNFFSKNYGIYPPNYELKIEETTDKSKDKNTIGFEPDIIITNNQGILLVIDAKYKENITKNDIHQIISYSLIFDAPGILCFPNDGTEFLLESYQIPNLKWEIKTISIPLNFKDYNKFETDFKIEIDKIIHGLDNTKSST